MPHLLPIDSSGHTLKLLSRRGAVLSLLVWTQQKHPPAAQAENCLCCVSELAERDVLVPGGAAAFGTC